MNTASFTIESVFFCTFFSSQATCIFNTQLTPGLRLICFAVCGRMTAYHFKKIFLEVLLPLHEAILPSPLGVCTSFIYIS